MMTSNGKRVGVRVDTGTPAGAKPKKTVVLDAQGKEVNNLNVGTYAHEDQFRNMTAEELWANIQMMNHYFFSYTDDNPLRGFIRTNLERAETQFAFRLQSFQP